MKKIKKDKAVLFVRISQEAMKFINKLAEKEQATKSHIIDRIIKAHASSYKKQIP